jgi:hypothetical protein
MSPLMLDRAVAAGFETATVRNVPSGLFVADDASEGGNRVSLYLEGESFRPRIDTAENDLYPPRILIVLQENQRGTGRTLQPYGMTGIAFPGHVDRTAGAYRRYQTICYVADRFLTHELVSKEKGVRDSLPLPR